MHVGLQRWAEGSSAELVGDRTDCAVDATGGAALFSLTLNHKISRLQIPFFWQGSSETEDCNTALQVEPHSCNWCHVRVCMGQQSARAAGCA